MALRIEKSFTVDAPRAAVWAFLIDPYRVASCLPGAAITEKIDERTYGGTIALKVGPVSASYKGKLRFERLDEAAGEAELSGSGQETKGKGGADMRMTSRVVEVAPGRTEVNVVSDVNVFGILAQMGRGMIQDVSDQMFGTFSKAAAASLTTAGVTALPGATATNAEPGPSESPSPAATTRSAPAQPAAPPLPAVLDVGALGAGAAKRATLRTLARPGFWIVLGGLLLLLLYFLSD
jgi:carbon monoxide dehydrogenase subunit G